MKLILTSLLTMVMLSTSLAQEEVKKETNDTERKKHALGIAVGATSAYGLSYRYYFGKFGIQGTFAPYKNEESEQIHAGITFIYNLVESRTSNFFVYQSNYFYWNRSDIYHWDYNSNPYGQYTIQSEVNYHFNHGLGIGIEFIIVKVVSLNLMGGYGAYEDFKRIGITGEAGLYYKF